MGSTCFGHYYAHQQELATMMLIITLVVSFCKDGGVSVNLNLWFLVVCVRCEVVCRFVAAGNVLLLILIVLISININRKPLPATTKRQRTSHRTHTTKNHKFTLTLHLSSLQNESKNVVINIIVASS